MNIVFMVICLLGLVFLLRFLVALCGERKIVSSYLVKIVDFEMTEEVPAAEDQRSSARAA